MGGSKSGVSVGHGFVSYERRRRDVHAGGPGVNPRKILKSQSRMVAFRGVCGTIELSKSNNLFFWSHVYAAAYLRTGSYATASKAMLLSIQPRYCKGLSWGNSRLSVLIWILINWGILTSSDHYMPESDIISLILTLLSAVWHPLTAYHTPDYFIWPACGQSRNTIHSGQDSLWKRNAGIVLKSTARCPCYQEYPDDGVVQGALCPQESSRLSPPVLFLK